MFTLSNPSGALRYLNLATMATSSNASTIGPPTRKEIPPIVPMGPDGPGGGFGPGGSGPGGGGGDDCTWETMQALSAAIDAACAKKAAECEKLHPEGYLFDCGKNTVNADCTVTMGIPTCTTSVPPKKTETE